jgi:hypothetical protein
MVIARLAAPQAAPIIELWRPLAWARFAQAAG